MSSTIQLLEEDATTTTLRVPKALASYIIHLSQDDVSFDLDFHEHTISELSSSTIMLAEQTKKIPRNQLINI